MKKIKKYFTIKKSAGSRPGNRVKSSCYCVIDNCSSCNLNQYIKIVCENDLSTLVLKGNPPIEVLEAARLKIITEFSVLTGGSSIHLNSTRKVYYYHSLIILYSLCAELILSGEQEIPVKVLNKNGLHCDIPNNIEETNKLIDKIKSVISEKKIRLKAENKKLSSIDDKKMGKPTRENFISSLVTISKHAGFRLTTDISLMEYASYLNDYKREIEQLKRLRYGKNNKKY